MCTQPRGLSSEQQQVSGLEEAGRGEGLTSEMGGEVREERASAAGELGFQVAETYGSEECM